jgi:hypothetical protein
MVERRGKLSAADLAVVPLVPGDQKPAPPEDMPEKEAEHWRTIVNAMPLRYFGKETWPVLRGLCKHLVIAEMLGKLIDSAMHGGKPAKLDEFERLLVLYNTETRAVRQHSADLRLTKIARISQQFVADRAVRNQVHKQPWTD